jgi:hypothetical protein
MSYKALYRTYRPTDFTEVAGQKHITTTLKNALKNGKVAHAYLFSGLEVRARHRLRKYWQKQSIVKKPPLRIRVMHALLFGNSGRNHQRRYRNRRRQQQWR